MGSEARIALNLHKRPRRRVRTWSVGIGEGCGDRAPLYIFDLRNASPRSNRSYLESWFHVLQRTGVPAHGPMSSTMASNSYTRYRSDQ
eukprot:scaffold18312_cov28-Phaeocystis_antarctica.AAC.2